MSSKTRWALLLGGALVLGACSDSTEPPERIVTSLRCEPGGTDEFNCAMEFQEEGSLHLKLETFTCLARGNTVRVLQPVQTVLSTDACYLPQGTTWDFAGPYPPGTMVEIEFASARLENPAGLRLEGDYPEWVVNFEDGGDDDFNDLVLTVTVDPSG